jgi:dTMP kinase
MMFGFIPSRDTLRTHKNPSRGIDMLVALAGCDGAGKSTQAKRVAEWLRQRGWQCEVVDRWRILDPEIFPECRFIRSSREEVRVCNCEMNGLSRAMFLFWTLSLAIDKLMLQNRERVFLVDGYWMKHAAAELEYGCDSEWIEATVRCFPPADLTYYLDIHPEVALRRKSVLTPYECARNAKLDSADFVSHQTKLRTRLQKWADELGWKIISSLQDPEFITEQIGSSVVEQLQRHGQIDHSVGAVV